MSNATVGMEIVTSTKGTEKVKEVESSIGELKKAFATLAVGAAALGVAIKKTFDFAQEGANIKQLGESFELVNKHVFHTPRLLEDLTDASKGTITQTEMMRGMMLLTAGNTKELSQAYADMAPRLMEIAKAANKLNPMLGSTSYLYDSLTRGIKRGSPLILDNLGIIIEIGEANKIWADKMNMSVKAMDGEMKQMALLDAVAIAGGNILDQVGNSTDSVADSYAQLATISGNLWDVTKVGVAEALLPLVNILNRSIPPAAREAALALGELSESVDLNAKFMRRLLDAQGEMNYWDHMTGAGQELDAVMRELVVSSAKGAWSFEELEEVLKGVWGAEMDLVEVDGKLRASWEDADGNKFSISLEEIWAWLSKNRVETEALSADNAMLSGSYQYATDMVDQYSEGLYDFAYNQRYAGNTIDAATEQMLEQRAMIDNLLTPWEVAERMALRRAEASEKEAEALEKAKEAAEAYAAKQTDAFESARTAKVETSLYTLALKDVGEAYVYVGGLNEQQKTDLEDLKDAYEKSQGALRDYELGVKGFGLEEDKLAEKIQKELDLSAHLSGQIEALTGIRGESVAISREAVWDMEKLNQELYDQGVAAGIGGEKIRDLAVATGVMSEAQAQAAFQSMWMEEQIGNLVEMLELQDITSDEASEALNLLASGEAESAKEAINLARETEAANKKFEEMNSQLDQLDGTTTATVDVVVTNLEAMREAYNLWLGLQGQGQMNWGTDDYDDPTGGDGRGPTPPKPDTNASGGMASGWTWVGERGRELIHVPDNSRVVDHERSESMAGGGGTVINLTVNVGGGSGGAGIAQDIYSELGSLMRTNNRSGAANAGRG